VIEALESLPDGLTLAEQRVAVRDYIESSIVKWPGTAGVFSLSANDHYGLTEDSLSWFRVEDGNFASFPQNEW
jgi:hypothetical protein